MKKLKNYYDHSTPIRHDIIDHQRKVRNGKHVINNDELWVNFSSIWTFWLSLIFQFLKVDRCSAQWALCFRFYPFLDTLRMIVVRVVARQGCDLVLLRILNKANLTLFHRFEIIRVKFLMYQTSDQLSSELVLLITFLLLLSQNSHHTD